MEQIKILVFFVLTFISLLWAIGSLFFPWYLIIIEKDQIESYQLWYRSGVYVTDKTQGIILSKTNWTWTERKFNSIEQTFNRSFILLYISIIALSIELIFSLSLLIGDCICKLVIIKHIKPVRYIFIFLSLLTTITLILSSFIFFNIQSALRNDQSVDYKGILCTEDGPCYHFYGFDGGIFRLWGPMEGWAASLGAGMFCLLTLLFSLVSRISIKTIHF